MSRRPRPRNVFVGTSEAGGFVASLAEGFRALGHPTTTGLCYGLSHYDYEYDIPLGRVVDAVDWRAIERRMLSPDPRVPTEINDESSPTDVVLWLLGTHDVFVFMYTSLWHDTPSDDDPFVMGIGREFKLLKRLGKKVVAVATGFDMRHGPALDQQLARVGHRGPPMAEVLPSSGEAPLARALRNLRRAERWADLIVSQPNMSSLAVRPYMHLFAPIDVRGVEWRVPGREVPVVVHAPTHFESKGSDYLIKALGALRVRGIPFKLRLFQGLSHVELMREMRDADVVVDQLHLPHGCVGVEAMASGSALATCDDRALEPWPPERPIWHIDPEGAPQQLETLLRDRDLRMKLGREGRRHALRHHDRVAVARSILQRLDQGPDAPMEHRPEFFAREYRLPDGETISPRLQRMTARIIDRWGLPTGVDRRDLVERGLCAALDGA